MFLSSSLSYPCRCHHHSHIHVAVIITLISMLLSSSLSYPCRCHHHSHIHVAVIITLISMSLSSSLSYPCRCHHHSHIHVAVIITLISMSLSSSLSYRCPCHHHFYLRWTRLWTAPNLVFATWDCFFNMYINKLIFFYCCHSVWQMILFLQQQGKLPKCGNIGSWSSCAALHGLHMMMNLKDYLTYCSILFSLLNATAYRCCHWLSSRYIMSRTINQNALFGRSMDIN